MLARAKKTGTRLIPHFKTHQSKEIGKLFRDKGVEAITVSSVKMAEYFAACGWHDITIAFPVNVLEVSKLNELLSQGVQLKLLVNHLESLAVLEAELRGKAALFIEVDAGYNRSGISADHTAEIEVMAEAIIRSDKMTFYGLYYHPGNTYYAGSIEEIRQIWELSIRKLNLVKEKLGKYRKALTIRMGDTPGCTVVEDMAGVDEIGPGNFVFYDLVMSSLGVCSVHAIAVAVACPVVAKNEQRKEIIIHGGAVHFSKDHLFDEGGEKFFGEMIILEESGWSTVAGDAKLKSVSQEHGILKVDDELFDKVCLGDIVGILPIHSCLTANLMKSYLSLDGQQLEHLEKVF